jgi:hypothetical protein
MRLRIKHANGEQICKIMWGEHTIPMADAFQKVLRELKRHGVLLQIDARLPNVCALVAGAPVRGSWWAHPKSHEIFHVNSALADHPDVLVVKLISGKLTYVERALWPCVAAIGKAREAWQVKNISRGARELLKEVDRAPVKTDRRLAKAASELEKSLLIYSEQFHTEAGSHARRLDTWDRWLRRTGGTTARRTPDQARDTLERLVTSLNQEFSGNGRLPWRP